MKRIASMANANDLLGEIAHLQSIGIHVPFALYAGQDDKHSTEVIVQIEQSGLGLPDRDYYTEESEAMKKIRAQYTAHAAKMFELLGDDAASAAKKAAVLLDIETRLAKASFTRVQRREPELNYHKYSLTALAELTPEISWPRLYEGMGINDTRDINVGQPLFLKEVDAMLKAVPLADWKTYLRWHLLSSSAAWLNSAFVDEDFAFHSRILTGATELKPRWKRASALVDHSVGDALSQLYVAHNFSPEAKTRALQLVANLRAELRERLLALDWMSSETKTQALRKLNSFAVKIGYPDKWRDYSTLTIDRGPVVLNAQRAREYEFRRNIAKLGKPVDRTEWHMTAPTVNAYYSQNMNEIVFSRRHFAAAVLRCQRRRRSELWRHWRRSLATKWVMASMTKAASPTPRVISKIGGRLKT